MTPINIRILALLGMTVAAAVWGATFIAQILAAREGITAVSFVAMRFLIGALVIFALSPVAGTRRSTLLVPSRGGVLLGGCIFIGSVLQQIGMHSTSAAKGGFITGLYLVGVPLIAWLFYKRRIQKSIWFAVLLSLIGLWLLCGVYGEHFIQGDLWVLACAVVFSLQVMLTSEIVREVDPIVVAFQQSLWVGILGSFWVLFSGSSLEATGSVTSILAILFAGVMSSGLAYTLQAVSQKYVSAPIAGLVLGLECLFAAVAGWIYLGERLTTIQMLGAALMLFGAGIAILEPGASKDPGPESPRLLES